MNRVCKSQSIAEGTIVVNIGTVKKVELFPESRLVRLVIEPDTILSCAFFWFRYNVILEVVY